MKKYPFTGAIEASALTSFIGDVIAGNAKPVLKSEEVGLLLLPPSLL